MIFVILNFEFSEFSNFRHKHLIKKYWHKDNHINNEKYTCGNFRFDFCQFISKRYKKYIVSIL